MTAPEPEVIAKARAHVVAAVGIGHPDEAAYIDFLTGILAAYDALATRCAAAEERAEEAEQRMRNARIASAAAESERDAALAKLAAEEAERDAMRRAIAEAVTVCAPFVRMGDTLPEMAQAITADLTAARAQVAAWHRLYRRALNQANALTNYVDERPALRNAEKALANIELDARALPTPTPQPEQEDA